jgi:hypothetical protein
MRHRILKFRSLYFLFYPSQVEHDNPHPGDALKLPMHPPPPPVINIYPFTFHFTVMFLLPVFLHIFFFNPSPSPVIGISCMHLLR